MAQIDIDTLRKKTKLWASALDYKIIVILFGSYVKKTATPRSDMDLYIILVESLSKTETNLFETWESENWEYQLTELIGIPIHLSFYNKYCKESRCTLSKILDEDYVILYNPREPKNNLKNFCKDLDV